jgi:hypothetical protein
MNQYLCALAKHLTQVLVEADESVIDGAVRGSRPASAMGKRAWLIAQASNWLCTQLRRSDFDRRNCLIGSYLGGHAMKLVTTAWNACYRLQVQLLILPFSQ